MLPSALSNTSTVWHAVQGVRNANPESLSHIKAKEQALHHTARHPKIGLLCS